MTMNRLSVAVAGLLVLAACSSSGGPSAASTAPVSTGQPSPASSSPGAISVTSTLDGHTRLPLRIHWIARPTGADVSEVDFLIDGKLGWVEHNSPYVYGDDGNWLVTSFLKPGEHAFTVRAIGVEGQVATDAVTASVSPAPAPPPALVGTWKRMVTAADVKKATSNQPPPTGQWGVRIFAEGWQLATGSLVFNGSHLVFDVAYPSDGKLQMRPTIDHPPVGNGAQGSAFCTDTDPLWNWSYAVSANRLTLHPIGRDPCGDRVAILEGTWTRVGA